MHDLLGVSLPLVVAGLAVPPTYVMAVGYKRTKSTRLYWATLAFFLFTLKGAVLFIGGLNHALSAEAVDLFEFSTNTAILVFFTISLVVTPRRGGRSTE